MTTRHSFVASRRLAVVGLLALAVGGATLGRHAAAAENDRGADAERAVSQGRYRDAIADYEAIVRQSGWSAPLLSELGSAYQKDGSLGRAIVSYERAQLLAPRDPAVVANLTAARLAAGLPSPTPPSYRRAAQLLSAREWGGGVVATAWLLALAVAGVVMRPRWRHVCRRVAYAALVAGAVATAGLALAGPRADDAIVIARGGTPLLLSPIANAAVEANVGEGTSVAVVARHGDFVRVDDRAGHVGWTAAGSVEPILARRS